MDRYKQKQINQLINFFICLFLILRVNYPFRWKFLSRAIPYQATIRYSWTGYYFKVIFVGLITVWQGLRHVRVLLRNLFNLGIRSVILTCRIMGVLSCRSLVFFHRVLNRKLQLSSFYVFSWLWDAGETVFFVYALS